MLRKADFRRFFGIFKSMLCALLMCFVVTNAMAATTAVLYYKCSGDADYSSATTVTCDANNKPQMLSWLADACIDPYIAQRWYRIKQGTKMDYMRMGVASSYSLFNDVTCQNTSLIYYADSVSRSMTVHYSSTSSETKGWCIDAADASSGKCFYTTPPTLTSPTSYGWYESCTYNFNGEAREVQGYVENTLKVNGNYTNCTSIDAYPIGFAIQYRCSAADVDPKKEQIIPSGNVTFSSYSLETSDVVCPSIENKDTSVWDCVKSGSGLMVTLKTSGTGSFSHLVSEYGASVPDDGDNYPVLRCLPRRNINISDDDVFIAKVNTRSDSKEVSFKITAKGTYLINWGDSVDDKYHTFVVRDNNYNTVAYSYASNGNHTIKIARIDDITTDPYDYTKPAISFERETNLIEIGGNLNKVFPPYFSSETTCKHPSFKGAFKDCTGLTKISNALLADDLYFGCSSYPDGMFESAFEGCTGLNEIYDGGLFKIGYATASNMFKRIFYNCTGLQEINDKLFDITAFTPLGATITVEHDTFNRAFYGSGLKKIPKDLFKYVGTIKTGAFWWAFGECSDLEELPISLFPNITAAELNGVGLFGHMFENCSKLGLSDNVLKQFIQPTLFENMNTAALSSNSNFNDSNFMDGIFSGTSLLQTCPEGFYEYGTEQGNRFAAKFTPKVSCLPDGALICPIDEVINSEGTGCETPTGDQVNDSLAMASGIAKLWDKNTKTPFNREAEGYRNGLIDPDLSEVFSGGSGDSGGGAGSEDSGSSSGSGDSGSGGGSADPDEAIEPVTGNTGSTFTVKYYCSYDEAATGAYNPRQTATINLDDLSGTTGSASVPTVKSVCTNISNISGWECFNGTGESTGFGLLGGRKYNEQMFVNLAAFLSIEKLSTVVCSPTPVITTGDGVKRLCSDKGCDNLTQFLYTIPINEDTFEGDYTFSRDFFMECVGEQAIGVLEPLQFINGVAIDRGVNSEIKTSFTTDSTYDIKWQMRYKCSAEQMTFTDAQKDWMTLITYSGYGVNNVYDGFICPEIKVKFKTKKGNDVCGSDVGYWNMNSDYPTDYLDDGFKCFCSEATCGVDNCDFTTDPFMVNSEYTPVLLNLAFRHNEVDETDETYYVEFEPKDMIDCDAGKWLKHGTEVCDEDCEAGDYCPAGSFVYDEKHDQNKNSCAELFGNAAADLTVSSAAKSGSETACFITCPTTTWTPNKTEVHYGEDGNKCAYNVKIKYVDTDGTGAVTGCSTANKTVGLNDEFDLCKTATNPGRTLNYWKNGTRSFKTNEKAKLSELTKDAEGQNEVTMKAESWEKMQYNITYYYDKTKCTIDGAVDTYSALVDEGDTFDLPQITCNNLPEGMEPKGWCIWDAKQSKNNGYECNNPKDKLETLTTGNKHAYARIAPHEYTIEYDATGGTMSGAGITAVPETEDQFVQKYTKSTTTIPLPKATKSHYHFVGWTDGKEMVAEIPANMAEDLRLIAKWDYIVELNPNTNNATYDGSHFNTWNIEENACKVDLPSKDNVLSGGNEHALDDNEGIERKGYTFLGWCIGKKTCGDRDADILLQEGDSICAVERDTVCPAEPASEGDPKCTVVEPDTATGIIKGYAQWSKDTYTITYLDEQTADGVATSVYSNVGPESYTVEDRVTFKTPTAPNTGNEGDDYYGTNLLWDFDGWYDGETKVVGFAPGTTVGNKILKAHWEPVMGKYQFVCSKENVIEIEGQIGSTSADQTEEANKLAPNGATCNGIDIETWSCSNGVGSIDPGSVFTFVPATETTVVCKAGYKIIYKNVIKGTEEIDTDLRPNSYTEDNEVFLPSDEYMNTQYSRVRGYSFGGWFYGYEPSPRTRSVTQLFSNQATILPTGLHGTRTFYGQWSPNTYSVSYKCEPNGESISGADATYDAMYNFSSESICTPDEGMLFKNWACFASDGYGANNDGLTCPSGTTKTNLISNHVEKTWDDGGIRVETNGDGEYKISGTATGTDEYIGDADPETGTIIKIPVRNIEIPANHWIELHNNQISEDGAVKLLLYFTDGTQDYWNLNAVDRIVDNGWSEMNGKTLEYIGIAVKKDAEVPEGFKFAPAINICSTSDNENIIYGEFDENTPIAEWKFPSDTVCVAQWTPIKYTINFITGAADAEVTGTMNPMENVFYGEDKNLNANAYKRSGYEFVGWCYGDGIQGNQCKENASVLADKAPASRLTTENGATVTLCAKWEMGTYRIIYVNAAPTTQYFDTVPATSYTIDVLNAAPEHKITIPAPHKNGYTFKGWCGFNEEQSGDDVTCSTPSQTVTISAADTLSDKWLYAQWEENVYAVALDKNYEGDAGYTPGTETIYEKYNKGWFKTFDASTEVVNDELSDTDGIDKPTRTHYQFDGYYVCPETTGGAGCEKIIDSEGKLVTGASTTVFSGDPATANGKLYAKWIGTFNLHFRCCGGTSCGTPGMPDQTVTFENTDKINKVKFIANAGYEFGGWCYGNDVDGDNAYLNQACCAPNATLLEDEKTPIPQLTNTAGETVQLGAYWKPIEYGIKYYLEKDEDDQWIELESYPEGWPKTYNIAGGTVNLPGSLSVLAPTKTGYDFDGWYIVDNPTDISDTVTSFEPSTSDLEPKSFYAKWKLKTNITCQKGKYLPKGKDVCEICEENNYCPSEGTYTYNTEQDQGMKNCSVETGGYYPYSVKGDNNGKVRCFAICKDRPHHTLKPGYENNKAYYNQNNQSLEDLVCDYDFNCETDVKLHIGEGEKDEICLYNNTEIDERPEADAYFGINVGEKPYYMCLTKADSEDAPEEMHYGSGNKLHIVIDGQEYYAHDASVLY